MSTDKNGSDRPENVPYFEQIRRAFEDGPEAVEALLANAERTPGEFVVAGSDHEQSRTELKRALARERLGPVDVQLFPIGRPVFQFTDESGFFFHKRFLKGNEPSTGVYTHALAWVWMKPQHLADVQAAAQAASGLPIDERGQLDPREVDMHDLIRSGVDDEKMMRIRAGLLERKPVVPAPAIELDRNRRLRSFQEGRHRALAAIKAGLDLVNVLVAVNRKKTDGWTPDQ